MREETGGVVSKDTLVVDILAMLLEDEDDEQEAA